MAPAGGYVYLFTQVHGEIFPEPPIRPALLLASSKNYARFLDRERMNWFLLKEILNDLRMDLF